MTDYNTHFHSINITHQLEKSKKRKRRSNKYNMNTYNNGLYKKLKDFDYEID